MYGEVGAVEFLLGVEAQADRHLDQAIHHEAAGGGNGDPQRGAGQLRQERHAAQPAQRLAAENAGRQPAPRAAQAVQRPHAQHVVLLPCILRPRKHHHEDHARHCASDQCAERVHQVRTGAHRDQAGQRAVVDEARIVTPQHQRGQGAADQRHQRIDGHQSVHLVERLRAHDVEAEPADGQNPRAERQERNRRRRVGGDLAFLGVAATPGAQQQNCRQCHPAAERVHHDGTGEVVEFKAEPRLERRLHAETVVPGDALEQRVDQADQHGGGHHLRIEPGAFGDAARDDGGNRGGERQQKEKLHQFVAVFGHQGVGGGEKMDAVGDAVADEKISDGRNGEIHQDFDERVDLIFLAHCTQFKESETGVHRQDHDCAEHDEKCICPIFVAIHPKTP